MCLNRLLPWNDNDLLQEKERLAKEKLTAKEETPTEPKTEETVRNVHKTSTNVTSNETKKTEEQVDIVASTTEAPKSPVQEVKQVILPDVTLVGESKEEVEKDTKEEKEEVSF